MSTERLIKWSTATAVICVATVAAVVSYNHAYALVQTYGEAGWTARLVPLTVDGLIYASSMVLLQAARRQAPVPRLARWLLALGITATLAANAAHGLGHGVVGAVVASWPAVALVGTYELLMLIIRNAPVSGRCIRTRVLPGAVPEDDPLLIQAADEFADDMAAGQFPSIRTIRARLRVGQPRAQQIRAYLSALATEDGGDAAGAPSAGRRSATIAEAGDRDA